MKKMRGLQEMPNWFRAREARDGFRYKNQVGKDFSFMVHAYPFYGGGACLPEGTWDLELGLSLSKAACPSSSRRAAFFPQQDLKGIALKEVRGMK